MQPDTIWYLLFGWYKTNIPYQYRSDQPYSYLHLQIMYLCMYNDIFVFVLINKWWPPALSPSSLTNKCRLSVVSKDNFLQARHWVDEPMSVRLSHMHHAEYTTHAGTRPNWYIPMIYLHLTLTQLEFHVIYHASGSNHTHTSIWLNSVWLQWLEVDQSLFFRHETLKCNLSYTLNCILEIQAQFALLDNWPLPARVRCLPPVWLLRHVAHRPAMTCDSGSCCLIVIKESSANLQDAEENPQRCRAADRAAGRLCQLSEIGCDWAAFPPSWKCLFNWKKKICFLTHKTMLVPSKDGGGDKIIPTELMQQSVLVFRAQNSEITARWVPKTPLNVNVSLCACAPMWTKL